MNNLPQAIWVEVLKARRSRISWVSALAISLLPLAGGFFMIILRDPDLALRSGLISAKATLTMGVADWPAYLAFLAMAIMGGGVMLFSLIASWVFGREYVDRTAKDLLALPTARSAIVMAKFLLVISWCAGLVVLVYAIGLGVGSAIGLPQAPPGAMMAGSITIAVTSLLTIVLVTPIAFVASAGHGYLLPMGIVILAVGFAQGFAITGWGEYFPWAIAGLYAQGKELGLVSYAILLGTGVAGVVGTVWWWERADQTR